jgi:HSP20 family molecular chaperone IbpA
MATDTRHKHEKAGGAPDIVRRPASRPQPQRWQGEQWSGPFGLMRQMQDEVDRWFGDRGWMSPSAWLSHAGEQAGDWMPAIDAFQRGSEFIIRADVPGMFWSERSYGSFSRVVPLPPGAISDSAKATFTNGVLEVVVQSPSQDARRGRKVDISGHEDTPPRTKS